MLVASVGDKLTDQYEVAIQQAQTAASMTAFAAILLMVFIVVICGYIITIRKGPLIQIIESKKIRTLQEELGTKISKVKDDANYEIKILKHEIELLRTSHRQFEKRTRRVLSELTTTRLTVRDIKEGQIVLDENFDKYIIGLQRGLDGVSFYLLDSNNSQRLDTHGFLYNKLRGQPYKSVEATFYNKLIANGYTLKPKKVPNASKSRKR